MSFLKWLILPLAAMLLASAPLVARASVMYERAGLGERLPDQALEEGTGFALTAPDRMTKPVELMDLALPAMPSVAIAELPQPSTETPLRKFFCVEYARARSGLMVFGDAKFWWARAKNLYSRMTTPMENTVMVFSGSTRLKKGHVAVVTNIVSKREIRVDQANWQNHGEIDHATPVLDVSAKNDWSKVRVWDMRSNGFGAHVYAISGFIAKELVKQAAND